MKRVLAVSLLLNGILAGGFLWERAIAQAGDVPNGNGDVNGDGTIDISDAIYLLANLFTGGPAVKAIECPPAPPPGGLPDTGQTKCYDAAGPEISCDSAVCPGQDGAYATGCPSEGRFLDHGDGTVTDNCTGLMWQKDTADVNGDGQLTMQDYLPWCEALAFCENLSFAGYDDWRLPNVREFQSIVDYGRWNPAIDPVFGGAFPGAFWSSTTYVGREGLDRVWFVYLGSGGVDVFGKDGAYYVQAVRGGP